MLRATWRKSSIGYGPDIRATVVSLGFRRLNQARDLPDNPAIRGMLRRVRFLVAVEGEPWVQPRRARYKMARKKSIKRHSRGEGS
ncbi:MAG: 50S ribosomal protein L30 [Candidatus Dormibacterales bacterium]